METVDLAYKKAFETIEKCSTKYGLYASGGKNGYAGIWSRDTNITFIGASTDSDSKFKETWRKSLEVLGEYQSKLGQIPNAVLNLDKKKRQADFKSIDSNLWFVIGHHFYKERYKDSSLFNKHKSKIKKAMTWLSYQDVGEDITLEQEPTTDWQDAFPAKYGETINTQALYYKSLILENKWKTAEKLKNIVNKSKEDGLWNGKFYWAYRWKNHNKYKEIGKWFDSLGNILAVIFELAKKEQSKKILSYIEKNKINRPYQLRDIYPTINKKSEYWQDYYYDAKATPNNYLNGGIWPFIGGLYIISLVKLKKYKQAEKELEILADANIKGNIFPEWVHPITKKTHGLYQAWSAGTYIWAYNSVKYKKTFL
ncbi:MAG: glycoside hydrolase 100 family protein [Nanoarchaeota archaeon]